MERTFPTEEQLKMMRRGMIRVEGSEDTLTIMEIDRPGVFGRVAGALSLCGLDVLEAVAHTDFGMVLAVFQAPRARPERLTGIQSVSSFRIRSVVV